MFAYHVVICRVIPAYHSARASLARLACVLVGTHVVTDKRELVLPQCMLLPKVLAFLCLRLLLWSTQVF